MLSRLLAVLPRAGLRYRFSVQVTNGAGLTTLVTLNRSLLFTEEPPVIEAARFGYGNVVGIHHKYSSSPSTATYTLDHIARDPASAALTRASLAVFVCPLDSAT